MTIYIQPGIGATAVDVTKYLQDREGSLSTLTQSREYRRFKRESGDVRVALSNHDGVVEGMLAAINSDSKLFLYVEHAGERLFSGIIAPERVEHDAHDEWFTITAYDPMARLTALMRGVKARPGFDWVKGANYLTLQQFLVAELMERHRMHLTGYFTSIDCGEFSGTTIHASRRSGGVQAGAFSDIDPNLMWDGLLEGIGVWWNADFWIEPATLVLKMTRRRSLTGVTRTVSDDVYDDTVTISLLDEDRVDWIRVVMPLNVPPLTLTRGAVNKYTSEYFRRLYSFNNDLVDYKCIYFKNDQPVYATTLQFIEIPWLGDALLGEFINISVPPGGLGTTRRALYRHIESQDPNGTVCFGPFYESQLNNQYAVDIEDKIGPTSQLQMIQQGKVAPAPEVDEEPQLAYFRINRATGQWEGPVYESEVAFSTVTGNIVDCFPNFAFEETSGTTTTNHFSGRHISYFFGNTRTFTEVQNQFADLFRDPIGVKLTVRGVAFKVGDEIVVDNVPRLAGRRNVIVKSVRTYMRSEKTELEAYL